MPEVTPRHDKKRNKSESFDQMLRRFKKKCERAGIVAEVRSREYYVKPNQKKHEDNQKRKRRNYLDKVRAEQAEARRKLTSRFL